MTNTETNKKRRRNISQGSTYEPYIEALLSKLDFDAGAENDEGDFVPQALLN